MKAWLSVLHGGTDVGEFPAHHMGFKHNYNCLDGYDSFRNASNNLIKARLTKKYIEDEDNCDRDEKQWAVKSIDQNPVTVIYTLGGFILSKLNNNDLADNKAVISLV